MKLIVLQCMGSAAYTAEALAQRRILSENREEALRETKMREVKVREERLRRQRERDERVAERKAAARLKQEEALREREELRRTSAAAMEQRRRDDEVARREGLRGQRACHHAAHVLHVCQHIRRTGGVRGRAREPALPRRAEVAAAEIDGLHRAVAPVLGGVVPEPLRVAVVEAAAAVEGPAGEHRVDRLRLVAHRRARGRAVRVPLPNGAVRAVRQRVEE